MGNPETTTGAATAAEAEATTPDTGTPEVNPAPALSDGAPALKRKVNGVVLGEKYRDSVLGTEGIAMTYVTHLTGCNRVGIDWVNKEGNVRSEFVDETRLIHIESGKQVKPESERPGHAGDPPRRGLR